MQAFTGDDCVGKIRVCDSLSGDLSPFAIPSTILSFIVNSLSFSFLFYFRFYSGITRKIIFSYTIFSWIFILTRITFLVITNTEDYNWTVLLILKMLEFAMTSLVICAAVAMISFFILFDYRMNKLQSWTSREDRIILIIYSISCVIFPACMVGAVSTGEYFYISNGFAWIEASQYKDLFYILMFSGYVVPGFITVIFYIIYRLFIRPRYEMQSAHTAEAKITNLYDVLDKYMVIFSIFNIPNFILVTLSMDHSFQRNSTFNSIKFVVTITMDTLKSVAVSIVLAYHFRHRIMRSFFTVNAASSPTAEYSSMSAEMSFLGKAPPNLYETDDRSGGASCKSEHTENQL